MKNTLLAGVIALSSAGVCFGGGAHGQICDELANPPKSVENASGSVKVEVIGKPEVCHLGRDGKRYVGHVAQEDFKIESTKRTNVVLYFSVGKDEQTCQQHLKDGKFGKGSLVVSKGVNDIGWKNFSGNMSSIEFHKTDVVCIGIENP